MAKPNYQFEKRQRELEKKKKKAEKAFKKSQGPDAPPVADGDAELDPATTVDTATTTAPAPEPAA